MTNQDRPMDSADLRQKAEVLAREKAARTPEDTAVLSPEEIRQILHELRVHQIELEIQNEELITAQARIEAGRARYFDLYDLAPVGYCTLSEKGLILEANLAAAKLLGTTRGLLVTQPISSFILKEDQDIYYLHRKKLFETGEPYECELRLVKSDGAFIWAHLTATAAQAEDGAPVCRCVISDITERKRAEESLRDSEARFKTIIQNLPGAVFAHDLEGRLLFVNKTACADTGYSEQELLAMTVPDIDSGDFTKDDRHQLWHDLNIGKSKTIQSTHTRKNGSKYPVEIHLNAISLDNQPVILPIVIDITERKRAEEDLKNAERHLRSTVDGLSAHIAVVDDYGEIILTNKAYRDFGERNGIEPRAVSEGTNYLAVCDTASGEHSQEAGPFVDGIREVLSGKRQSFEMEYPCHSPDEKRWFIGRVTPFAGEGPRIVIIAHENITEQKRAEERRQEGFDLLKKLARLVPGVIYQYRLYPDGRSAFPYSSPGMHDIYEVMPEEVREDASVVFGRIHPEDQDRVAEAIFESARTLNTFHCELRVILPKQGLRWRWSQAHPERTEDGGTLWHGIILDITERKQAEEELKRRELTLNKIFDVLPIGLWFADKNGKLIKGNPAGVKIWGAEPTVPMEEYGVFKARRLPSGEEIAPNDWALAHTIKNRTIITDELLEIDAFDGQKKIILNYTAPVIDDAGEMLGAIVVNNNITERKRAEAERELLITAIEQGDDVVIITDIDGLIQYANPAFETVTGYTRKEVLAQNPRIFKSGKQGEAFYREMWDTLTSGNTFHGRMINKRKDGSLYTEDATISPVRDATGNIVNYVAVKRDVTARIQLETQLLQAQKMESVGRLAGGVAHDYNNMLSVILGYTEMTMEQVDPDDPMYDNLKEIFTAGKRSMEITGQLLAFARKQIISPVVMDLNETVDGMLKMLRRLIGEDIDIAWEPAVRLWPVNMDPSQIDQILANLCVNARDAISGVGKITIETENVCFDESYCAEHAGFIPGDFVMLAVSDNGCGMDKETLKQIFEPFFTTKDIGKGTGLGLPMIYGIVKQNNGFVNVYSEPGNGTTFRIYLPRHTIETDEAITEVTHEEVVFGQGETLLLVEDEPAIIKMCQTMLEKLGYNVLIAHAPDEAVNLASEHSGIIHLLMSDVIMPGMNGRDLADKLQAIRPDIRVLFMSGYTADVIAHHGVLDEGEHFIQKPFSMKNLSVKVREALEGGKSTQQQL